MMFEEALGVNVVVTKRRQVIRHRGVEVHLACRSADLPDSSLYLGCPMKSSHTTERQPANGPDLPDQNTSGRFLAFG